MNKNNGGPAFPVIEPNDMSYQPDRFVGMSLRDYFAAKAMEGLCMSTITDRWGSEMIAIKSYEIADAMLKAREVQ